MFYDTFLGLCKEFGVTPAQVRKDLNISQSTMASWKSRGLTPNAQTLVQLAEYFRTTPAYLMGNPMAKSPIYFEIRDQESKDYVKRRFTEAEVWKTRLDEIGQDLGKLNDEGQVEAVKRVKELTELEKYKYKRKPSPLSTGITVYRDGPAGLFPPAPQSPPAPQEGKDTTPPPEGAEGTGEGE